MPTDTVQNELSPENEAFVARQLEQGTYESERAVINAGLDLLRERQALLDEIAEGFRQLDEGEYTEYDQAGLRRRFDQLQERLQQRIREGGSKR